MAYLALIGAALVLGGIALSFVSHHPMTTVTGRRSAAAAGYAGVAIAAAGFFGTTTITVALIGGIAS